MPDPLIQGGYILLSRKIMESEIWDKPPLYFKVWIYLLSLAQHKEYKQLKRGQLRTSIPEIIEACSWKIGARTEKPTKDQIYQILDWLRKPNIKGEIEGKCSKTEWEPSESNTKATMITTTKATHGLLITIDNYWLYQDPKNYESNGEGNDEKATKPTRKQRQPDNINKNINNDKNDKKKDTSVSKIQYAEEVTMTEAEYQKLVTKYGEQATKKMIEKLDNYKIANKRTYASDYRAILSWVVEEIEKKHPELFNQPKTSAPIVELPDSVTRLRRRLVN